MVTFSTVVSACRNCKMPQRVSQLFEETQQQGLEPRVITYAAVISPGVSPCSAPDAAAGTSAKYHHIHAVVSACKKCEMPERTLQLFDEVQQQGLGPNVINYPAAIVRAS